MPAIAIVGTEKSGLCYGSPPQMVPLIDKGAVVGAINIRPQLPRTETACAAFVLKSAAAPINPAASDAN
ncbi:MAG: hypothetical protein ACYDDA_03845 [Acidiferrobacteraceae bacterium]